MRAALAPLTTFALLAGSAALAEADHTHFRVFVADHADARITALDLANPAARWTFPTKGQAKLYPLAGGAVVAAVQSDDDAVLFLSSGVTRHDHGDHADLTVADPAALAPPLTGPRPFHVVAHDGQVVVHYDKGGYAEILSAAALATGQLAPTRFTQARAHHGFVAPFGPVILSTVAADTVVDGDASVPRLGLQAFDAAGVPQGDLATCTAIHGEAFSGAYLAAGCKEGVLTATLADGQPVFGMLPYPADFPEGTTGTLLGSTGMQVFLGNHGAAGLVVIDPVDAPQMRRIDLPFRRVDFTLDPARPDTAWALTEDGSLHRIDLLAASIRGSVKVTAPYSMEGHWNDPRPRLAVAGDEVLLTDPLAGLLRRIDATTLTEKDSIALDGVPYTLTVVGGSGVQH